MRKIVFISNCSWTMYNFRLGVIQEQLKKGYKVYIYVPRNELINESDNTYELLEDLGCLLIDIPLERKGKSFYKDIKLLRALYDKLNEHKPDLVFLYTSKPVIYGSFASYLNGIKNISILTGLGHTFVGSNTLKYLMHLMYFLSLKFTDKLWLLNEDDRLYFVRNKLIDSEKIFVLKGEGINTEYYKKNLKTIDNDKTTFLLIARMLKEKGIFEYVKAAKEIAETSDNVKFQLLGYADDNNPSAISLEQILEWEKKGSIQYLGSTEDVRPYIDDSDCVVLPSYYGEGLPRTLLESLSMETPIITTETVGCKDVIVDGKNGFLCKSKDCSSLQSAMGKIIGLEIDNLREMGKWGREFVIANYDERKIIKIYDNIIDN